MSIIRFRFIFILSTLMHPILQWNIRGLRGNSEELKVLLSEHNPYVVCLQETMIKTFNYNIGLNYKFYGSTPIINHNNNRPLGGAAIIVKNNISHQEVQLRTTLQAVAIRATLKKEYTICFLYLDPRSQVTFSDLQDLVNQLNPPFLILGDLNAHNPLWHSNYINQKGQIIERLINENHISILNDESPTYYNIHHNTTSIIGLGLCSSNTLLDFKWSVSSNLHDSDHYPIFIDLTTPLRLPLLPKWNLDKADWPKFYKKTSKIEDINNIEDSIEAYEALEELILTPASESIPKTKPSKGKPPVPWWDDQCKKLRRITLKCYSRYRATPTNTNKLIYKRAVAKKKKYFKEAKRKSWNDYISKINSNTPMTTVWSKVRKLMGK